MLRGRRAECLELDRLLEAMHAGQSAVLVLRGEAGIGKTALLEYTAERAEGCRVLHAVGVESEMELPFAGLHQLCAPLLGGLGRLPPPQREALLFGRSTNGQRTVESDFTFAKTSRRRWGVNPARTFPANFRCWPS